MKVRHHLDFGVLLHRVIDSDTIAAWIVVSPGVALLERIRLKGIEGGEEGTREGARAKCLLVTILDDPKNAPFFVVGCRENRDNHGRLVADIRLRDNSLLCQTLMNSGIYWARSARVQENTTETKSTNKSHG